MLFSFTEPWFCRSKQNARASNGTMDAMEGLAIPVLYTLVSIVLVSAVSLVGAVGLAMNKRWFALLLPALVGLAAGALLGDAFIHLIPESFATLGDEHAFSLTIILGIASFFVLEKYLRWHHAHHGEESEHVGHDCEGHPSATPLAPLVIIADGLHNVVDGVLIAASYLVSIPLGIATTIAVFLHEIPQEIADYALLVHAGLSHRTALLFNFLSALTALAGAALAIFLAEAVGSFTALATAFTAGGFIYIATADLIPELQKHTKAHTSLLQAVAFALGIAVMFALTALEVA